MPETTQTALLKIRDYPANGNSEPDVMERALDEINRLATEAIKSDPTPALIEAVDESDVAFACLNICDDLTPQARAALKTAWAKVQAARVLLKPNGVYAEAVQSTGSALNTVLAERLAAAFPWLNNTGDAETDIPIKSCADQVDVLQELYDQLRDRRESEPENTEPLDDLKCPKCDASYLSGTAEFKYVSRATIEREIAGLKRATNGDVIEINVHGRANLGENYEEGESGDAIECQDCFHTFVPAVAFNFV